MSHLIVDGKHRVVDVTDKYVDPEDPNLKIISPHDIGSYQEAMRLAEEATLVSGKKFLPCDHGEWRLPRYAVVGAPAIGDPVSYGFNGDYYPCGYITKVSDSYYRVETSTGDVFYRSKHTASWKKKGGTWWMVAGHIDERNPHI